MSDLNLWLAVVGGLTLGLSLVTAFVRSRVYVPPESIVAVAVGVAVGPLGLDLLDLARWGDPLVLLEEVARLTVALAVTSIALRLPRDYFRRRATTMAAILGPGMVAMWLASALAAYAVLDVPLLVALLVGAVVCPTDPVLANTIIAGKTAETNVPERLRFLLSGEAGANDGLAHPFVFLAVLLAGRSADAALVEWLLGPVLWGVGGAVVLGAAIGGATGYVERVASRREVLERTAVLTVTVALTFAVLGAVRLVGGDDILAVFVAGLAYNWLADPKDEAAEQEVEEVLNRLFTIPVFVVFGVAIPWQEWLALGWRGPALVAAVLAVRRLPMVLALGPLLEPLDRPAGTLFVGWFGPIGIAALFYATLAVHETGLRVVWVAGSLVVAGSILAHGLTATPFTLWYGRLDDDAGG